MRGRFEDNARVRQERQRALGAGGARGLGVRPAGSWYGCDPSAREIAANELVTPKQAETCRHGNDRGGYWRGTASGRIQAPADRRGCCLRSVSDVDGVTSAPTLAAADVCVESPAQLSKACGPLAPHNSSSGTSLASLRLHAGAAGRVSILVSRVRGTD